jgi:hypothetical protein
MSEGSAFEISEPVPNYPDVFIPHAHTYGFPSVRLSLVYSNENSADAHATGRRKLNPKLAIYKQWATK